MTSVPPDNAQCSGHRSAKISIDLQALKHNFQRVRELTAGKSIMPVVKANAYGHGVRQIVEGLQDANGFAVAQLDEAIALRKQGVSKPIAVFHGFSNAQQLARFVEYQLSPAISQPWQIDLLLQANPDKPLNIWLKVNTGMGRLGFPADQVAAIRDKLAARPHIESVSLMMHFANADQPQHPLNQQQVVEFSALASQLNATTSVSNSAAIITQLYHGETWVRPGIMLYGASPLQEQTAASLGLKAVMTFSAELIAINQLAKGHLVGYGSTWSCPEDMPTGIVNAGYGDGYPRHATTGTPVIVNGQRTQVLGRVSMDSIIVDLRNVQASCGDTVELWGKQLPVDEVARRAQTISYELLCNAGRGFGV